MTSFACHECGEPLDAGNESWRAPEDGRPDEAGGEPYCAACASPLGLAA
jgi:hypothetical protein